MANFDDILISINDWGIYQKLRYFLICLAALLPPIATFEKKINIGVDLRYFTYIYYYRYLYSFVAPNLSFECDDDNTTILYFKTSENNCQFTTFNDTVYKCLRWKFDKSFYQSTLTEEWNMICGKTYLRANIQTIYFLGYLSGSLVLGQLSDLYGRKPIFTTSLFLILLGAFGSAFGVQEYFGMMISYIIFTLSRFIIAVGTRGINETGYVLALELMSSKNRTYAAIGFEHFFSIGQLILVAFAYFFRDWRILSLIFISPCIPFIFYYFLMPESPRWLISKNQPEKAYKILESVARSNKTNLNKEIWESFLLESKNNQKPDETFLTLIKSLIKYPMLLILLMTMFLNWSITSFVFYGVSLRANDLGVNPYLSFAISAFVELFAMLFTLIIIDKIGRKRAYSSFLLTAGISLLSIALIDNIIISLILAMIGKFTISASYAILRLYSNEVFPTSIRSSCLGACSTISRLGVIFAPIINSLGDRFWKLMPFLIFGILAILGSLSTFFLPETKNKNLPDSLEEANNLNSLCLFKKEKNNESIEIDNDFAKE